MIEHESLVVSGFIFLVHCDTVLRYFILNRKVVRQYSLAFEEVKWLTRFLRVFCFLCSQKFNYDPYGRLEFWYSNSTKINRKGLCAVNRVK